MTRTTDADLEQERMLESQPVREKHFVYGLPAQYWEARRSLGAVQVDTDTGEAWERGTYRAVEWPGVIPEPIKPGQFPRDDYFPARTALRDD